MYGGKYFSVVETVSAGSSATIVDYSGSGLLRFICMRVDGASAQGTFEATLNIYVDGNTTPALSAPLLAIAGGTVAAGEKSYTRWDGTNYIWDMVVRLAIKFTTSLKVEFVNNDTVNATTLTGTIEVITNE